MLGPPLYRVYTIIGRLADAFGLRTALVEFIHQITVEHRQRETTHRPPLITARLRVDAIPIQLANKVITR